MAPLRKIAIALLSLGCLVAVAPVGLAQTAAPGGKLDKTTKSQIATAVDVALQWIRFKEEANGSWNNHPGITALVTRAFMESRRQYTEEDGPFVKQALAYIASFARPDGAIYDKDLPNYNTAVAVLALKAAKNPKYQPMLDAAQQFLLRSQLDESQGYTPDNPFYGAIGLGSTDNKSQPDLDNTGFALASLKVLGVPAAHPVWQKALVFLQRCQNRKESNDQPWAGSDGGFVFRPGFSYAGGTTSYASMTYVGLQSLLATGLQKNDPRVQAAVQWIRGHYTFDENPGMGQQALYHYYYFVANALHAYGEPLLVDAAGMPHAWRSELAQKIIARVSLEGFWVNENKAWWEGNPTLSTAFAILALERIYNEE